MSVEISEGHAQYLGEAFGCTNISFVNAQLVAIDTRARDELIQPYRNAKLLLRKARSDARSLEARAKNAGDRTIRHSSFKMASYENRLFRLCRQLRLT